MEDEAKAALAWIDNTPTGDPDPIELRARIVMLEGLMANLIKRLPQDQRDHVKAELDEAARLADDLNAQSSGPTVGEELHHQLHIAARDMLQRLND